MKILFISAFVPINKTAGQNYSRLLLNNLADMGHDIDLFLFRNEKNVVIDECLLSKVNTVRYQHVSKFKKLLNVVSCLQCHPFFSARFNTNTVSVLSEMVINNKYDIIYYDFSQVFLYYKSLSTLSDARSIFMSHDVITQKYERSSFYINKLFVRDTENRLLSNLYNDGQEVYTFSDKDSKYIFDTFKIPTKTTNFYLDDCVINAYPSSLGDYFVLFGYWKRYENESSLTWLLDAIESNKSLLHCSFRIIGGGLSPKIVSRLASFSNVEYLGFVSNPYPIIANANALIAPLFLGAGVKVKVIEAFACGTPVIGTEIAFEGLPTYVSEYQHSFANESQFLQIMNNFSVQLEDKNRLKQDFLTKYNDKNILLEFTHGETNI